MLSSFYTLKCHHKNIVIVVSGVNLREADISYVSHELNLILGLNL